MRALQSSHVWFNAPSHWRRRRLFASCRSWHKVTAQHRKGTLRNVSSREIGSKQNWGAKHGRLSLTVPTSRDRSCCPLGLLQSPVQCDHSSFAEHVTQRGTAWCSRSGLSGQLKTYSQPSHRPCTPAACTPDEEQHQHHPTPTIISTRILFLPV